MPALAGTQWHPEKPPYEFGMDEVPHSLDAIRVSQHLSNVFMEHARMSYHRPESKEQELAMQIYSTAPIFSARFEVGGARPHAHGLEATGPISVATSPGSLSWAHY